MKFKRYCKTLRLKDDPELIKEHIKVHSPDNIWPEISQEIKESGIHGMKIYPHGSLLFMTMDAVPDSDHERAMGLVGKSRQKEWGAFVYRFQVSGKKIPPQMKSGG